MGSVAVMSLGGKQKPLQERHFSYNSVGVTQPGEASWSTTGPRPFEKTLTVSDNPDAFEPLSQELMNWKIKTRSGFRIDPQDPVAQGKNYWLIATFGPLVIKEPARIVEVIDEPARKGFSYGTLVGHPVSGEEAFVLSRNSDGVFLTLRSVTAPGSGVWRLLFPITLVAQRVYRRRYSKALMTH